jgi:membrane protein DedA with SNARE-associated domain
MNEPSASTRPPARFAGRWWARAGIGALVIALAVYIAVEGDLTENFIDIGTALQRFIRRFGIPASLALLYIEESGVPLPVPGDVYVTYVGHVAAGSIGRLIGVWLAIIAVVTAGATNLYLISHYWGRRLIAHPLARVFHLEPSRMKAAQGWFQRWGVLAIIFGRHIPGFRVPLTFVAGTLGFPYRLFAPSVAVSTAIWAGVLIIVGDLFLRTLGRFLARNAWLYAVGTILVLAIVIYFVVRAIRLSTADPDDSKSDR